MSNYNFILRNSCKVSKEVQFDVSSSIKTSYPLDYMNYQKNAAQYAEVI